MDMHNHQSSSTPWNANLTYAIGWSIVLALPILFLTGRHIVSLVLYTNSLKGNGSSFISDNKTDRLEDSDDDEHRPEQQYSGRKKQGGVDIPSSTGSSKRWSYNRFENWISNKASATLYFGSFAQFVAGVTLVALIYLAILAVLLLYKVDLLLNSNRAGFLGLSCIPFLFAFAGKNSVVSFLTGISHHRINQAHRFIGLCLFIATSVHMGCMIHVWLPWKNFLAQQLATPKVQYGIATYTTLCLIVLTAAWPVRRWAYETFVVSHSLFLVFLILVGLHTPYAMRFTVAGIFCYLINVLTGWFVKTHVSLAQATVFQNRITRLRMDTPVPHSPGQHIYVCVPSISLIQWHPFTISGGDDSSITIHARAVGGFTRNLCKWPENTQRRVILAGPYGESVNVGRELGLHKTIFVAAGSGLAYIVPILMDFLKKRNFQKSSNHSIEIAWCVRDPDEVQWFQEELEVILDAAQGFLDMPEKDKEDIDLIASEASEISVRLLIHHTSRAFCEKESLMVQAATNIPLESSASTTVRTALNTPFAGDERVEWCNTRLDVPDYIRKQITQTPLNKTIEIVGCGPSQMLAELHNVVGATDTLSGCRVNLHTERFYV
ncbi:hypothetical protein BGZ76_009758 [Entomortierella beljakovae]|nr:hypothetical protein BGZ76_009758 [Entomortierella beljakovae]